MGDLFDENKTKKLYYKFIDNDPIIHSNRFPTWDELTEKTRQEWRDLYKTLNTPSTNDGGVYNDGVDISGKTCGPEHT